MRNTFLLFVMSALFFFSCKEEKKKDDFENDQYIDIMGAPHDTLIGKSGLRMRVPSLYSVSEVQVDSGATIYQVIPVDRNVNRSSIRILLGMADTTSPEGNFQREEQKDELFGKPAHRIEFHSGDHYITRVSTGDWNGKVLTIESETTNPVETFNLSRVLKSIRPDSSVK